MMPRTQIGVARWVFALAVLAGLAGTIAVIFLPVSQTAPGSLALPETGGDAMTSDLSPAARAQYHIISTIWVGLTAYIAAGMRFFLKYSDGTPDRFKRPIEPMAVVILLAGPVLILAGVPVILVMAHNNAPFFREAAGLAVAVLVGLGVAHQGICVQQIYGEPEARGADS